MTFFYFLPTWRVGLMSVDHSLEKLPALALGCVLLVIDCLLDKAHGSFMFESAGGLGMNQVTHQEEREIWGAWKSNPKVLCDSKVPLCIKWLLQY